jgi:enoyl-CoA hydratase/carnithine racemase
LENLMGNVLLEERRDAVVCVTLNRPNVLNALNSELRSELREFWIRFRDSAELGVAIVTGAGRAFSSGRDLKETAAADTAGQQLAYEATGGYGYPADISIGKPVIVAINGHCMAAGLRLAIGADIRIASTNATFSNPQVARGRGTRMPYDLIRAGVPKSVVMDLVLTGESIDAMRALEVGLISRVVEPEELLPLAWSIGEKIAANSQTVVRGIKRASESGLLSMSENEAHRLWEPVTNMMMTDSADAREGARSFSEGRAASFSAESRPRVVD